MKYKSKKKNNKKGGGRLINLKNKVKKTLKKINPFKTKTYSLSQFKGNNNNSIPPPVPEGFNNINFSKYEPQQIINMSSLPPPPLEFRNHNKFPPPPKFVNNNNNSNSLPPPQKINSKRYKSEKLSNRVLKLKNSHNENEIIFCNKKEMKRYKIKKQDIEAVMPYNDAIYGIDEKEINAIINRQEIINIDKEDQLEKDGYCDFSLDGNIYIGSGAV
jgi:hypothetical protein